MTAYVCGTCGHERLHLGVKEYVCPVCARAFMRHDNLARHVQSYHPNCELPPRERRPRARSSTGSVFGGNTPNYRPPHPPSTFQNTEDHRASPDQESPSLSPPSEEDGTYQSPTTFPNDAQLGGIPPGRIFKSQVPLKTEPFVREGSYRRQMSLPVQPSASLIPGQPPQWYFDPPENRASWPIAFPSAPVTGPMTGYGPMYPPNGMGADMTLPYRQYDPMAPSQPFYPSFATAAPVHPGGVSHEFSGSATLSYASNGDGGLPAQFPMGKSAHPQPSPTMHQLAPSSTSGPMPPSRAISMPDVASTVSQHPAGRRAEMVANGYPAVEPPILPLPRPYPSSPRYYQSRMQDQIMHPIQNWAP
ncbi:hypothetical protein M427DRAFT_305931 [Gonapodya prolifera JEL478]|uniref:C2H2-type domain-containing protein n=1 Tax=Gonapodya prolifera (strain JEL478) TaxID=1344416 RepID=A0A139AHA1_GONPJ|nr:hypothetical protein M427DRAFT_305931 [Gonapodya prolifera JEL478]|eukprot:KXS15944.1 hypothetical protein M427DRAFT_305931 [Gonapodya prolifera JEL478]